MPGINLNKANKNIESSFKYGTLKELIKFFIKKLLNILAIMNVRIEPKVNENTDIKIPK